MSRPSSVLAICALFLAAMLGFFLNYDAYTSGGPDIVAPLDFSSSDLPRPWQRAPQHAEVENGALRLGSGTGKRDGGTLQAEIDMPHRFEAIRVRARMRTEQLKIGEYGWDTTRLILFFMDDQKQARWDHPHNVCNFSGSHDWTDCEAVIDVPDFAEVGHVFVGNASAKGTAWIDDLSVTACTRRAEAWRWTALFAIGWSACLIWACVALQLWRSWEGVGVLLLAVAIVLGVLVPESVFTSTGHRVIESWRAWTAPTASSPAATSSSSAGMPTAKPQERAKKEQPPISSTEAIREFKKLGHAVLFSCLGGLSLWACRRRGVEHSAVPLTIVGLVVFAAGTEIAQFLTTTRTPLMSDFVIDSGGVAIGLAVVWALSPLSPLSPLETEARRR